MDGPSPSVHRKTEPAPAHRHPEASALVRRGQVAPDAPAAVPRIAQGAYAKLAVVPELGRARHPGRPVREIMTAEVVTFASEVSIEEATRVMLQRHISGAPVVDADNKPIGIVSKTDLLEAWHEHVKEVGPNYATEPTGVVVGDIMVPYLLAAQDVSPISLAAALMAYEGVHRLLVLNEANDMVGIVSSLDVLRWLAQLSGFCMERGDVPRALAPA